MKVSYKTKKLYSLCNDQKQASKLLGAQWKKLFRCKSQLVKASNLVDIQGLGKLEQLKYERTKQFSMRIDSNWRIIFVCANEPVPKLPDGNIDWKKVTEIEVIEIGKHYG